MGEHVQAETATAVGATVGAQNVQTAAAESADTETLMPTPIPLVLPTLTPILETATPFVIVPPSNTGGSGGGGAPAPAQYACSWTELKPRTNIFSPGDPIDVRWVITNTGSESFGYKRDLDYVSGTKMSSYLGEQLPDLKPGDTITIDFDANAPSTKGLYGMQFKVEGGLCWPALNIQVGGKKQDP